MMETVADRTGTFRDTSQMAEPVWAQGSYC